MSIRLLARYDVKIICPGEWGEAQMDAACEVLDEIDLAASFRAIIRQRIDDDKRLEGLAFLVEE